MSVSTLTTTAGAALLFLLVLGSDGTPRDALAQNTAPVDFARDVQPLFKQHCVTCHGPTQQMSGFRLDRRRDAMKGGQTSVIGPGNGAGSKLYLRLIGSDYGLQMPPTGPLKAEQIQVIKQ